jgi:hypothetical protein
MRHKQLILALFAAASTALLSGCVVASHTANGKSHTDILGGMIVLEEGAFEKQPEAAFPLNTDYPPPGSDLSGDRVSLLWGLISYRNQ